MKTQTKFPVLKVLTLTAIILFAGCKKESLNPSSGISLGSMPAHFVQRVMLEEVTAEWCSNCPSGAQLISQYKQQFGDSLIAVSIHTGDFLNYSTRYDSVIESFSQYNLGLPCSAINRVQDAASSYFWYSSGNWQSSISSLMANDHATGIALKSSIQGDSATIEVHIGFHTTNSYDMRLNVFLVENNIPSQQQELAGGGYYSGSQYLHQQVVRNIATPIFGDPFSMASIQEIVRTYKVCITGYSSANLMFAVSAEKWGSSVTDREVFNARQVAVGDVAKWQ